MKSIRIGCGLLLLIGASRAQDYVIGTIAGGAPPPSPAAALAVPIGVPQSVATDTTGNVYFTGIHCVIKLDQSGVTTVVAGNSRAGYAGDGGPATSAQLYSPTGVAVDASGNLFISDTRNSRVRKVSPDGIITTVAGNGNSGFSGDGGPATSAQLNQPGGIAIDPSGNLIIVDTSNFRVRKISTDGSITTVAGFGALGSSGDGGSATSAQLFFPRGVAVDGSGNMFIADSSNNRVRKVSTNGIITTVAGNGTRGDSGDGRLATSAQLATPIGVAIDGSGNMFIADANNSRVRKVSTDGIISTVAGTGNSAFSGDGGPATSARLWGPEGVAVDGASNLFIVDSSNRRVRKVSTDGSITTVAGNGDLSFSGDGGPATSAQLSGMKNITIDGSGNLFFVDQSTHRVRKIATDGIITTVAGNGTAGFSGDGGPATSAKLDHPAGVAVDGSGNLFIADSMNHRIRKVATDGIITTVAGTGNAGFSGDGGPATSGRLYFPDAVVIDASGNLFIADSTNVRVRKIATDGIITTVAGNGTPGFSGDGGPATSAQLFLVVNISVDGSGNIFITTASTRVRKVSTDGIITTVAGNGTPGFSGDGGPATSAQLNQPSGIAVDGSGNLFIADSSNNRIRRISNGIITTVAGSDNTTYFGDGGPATSAQLNQPSGIAVDGSGNLFICDSGNFAVRLLTR